MEPCLTNFILQVLQDLSLALEMFIKTLLADLLGCKHCLVAQLAQKIVQQYSCQPAEFLDR